MLVALAEQHAELDGILVGLDDDGWAQASLCDGWSVSDVVLHLAQTDEMAIASVEGRMDAYLTDMIAGASGITNVDDGAELMVTRERGAPGPEVGARWRASAALLRALFDAADLQTRVQWVAGHLSTRTLATTRLSEAWIHTRDVAEPLGVTLEPSPRLRYIARLAWRTIPYAFARSGRTLHGPVAFELRGTDGETWSFRPDDVPDTVVRGDATDLCLVAARRVEPSATTLRAEGPDADGVLELVRTFA